jgi:hypothetical protein
MLIMVVFDPLAVLLLIAANMSMGRSSVGKPIVKNGEVVGLTPSDIPVFADKKIDPEEPKEPVEPVDDRVKVDKENIAEIKPEEDIIIDGVTGESIPPISNFQRVHHAPGLYSEHHDEEPVKKLEPKYDYEAEFAFREKDKK